MTFSCSSSLVACLVALIVVSGRERRLRADTRADLLVGPSEICVRADTQTRNGPRGILSRAHFRFETRKDEALSEPDQSTLADLLAPLSDFDFSKTNEGAHGAGSGHQHTPEAQQHTSGMHQHASPRSFEHAGRNIEIYTSYRVVIDGVEYPDSLGVGDDGSVHYHAFPQYQSPSAVDVVKRIVEGILDRTPERIEDNSAGWL